MFNESCIKDKIMPNYSKIKDFFYLCIMVKQKKFKVLIFILNNLWVNVALIFFIYLKMWPKPFILNSIETDLSVNNNINYLTYKSNFASFIIVVKLKYFKP